MNRDRRATGIVLGLLLASVLSGACGRKGPIIAPELVRPEPATDLGGVSTDEGVQLTWTRPVRYSGGQRMRDLRGFVVERAPADDLAAPFVVVGTVELDDQSRFRPERRIQWIDRDAVLGTRYRYRVTARTLDGYESSAAGPVTVRHGPRGEKAR